MPKCRFSPIWPSTTLLSPSPVLPVMRAFASDLAIVLAITVLQFVIPWGSSEQPSCFVTASIADQGAHGDVKKGLNATAANSSLVYAEESCVHAHVVDTLASLKVLHDQLQRYTTRRAVGVDQALVDFEQRVKCSPQGIVAWLCTALTTPCTEEKPDVDTWLHNNPQETSADACRRNLGDPAILQELQHNPLRLALLRTFRGKENGGSALHALPPAPNGAQATQDAPHLLPSAGLVPTPASYPERAATSCVCPGPQAAVTSVDLVMFATLASEQLCFPAGTRQHAAEVRLAPGAADGSHVTTSGSSIAAGLPHGLSDSRSQQSPHALLMLDVHASQPSKDAGAAAMPATINGGSRPVSLAPRDPGLSPQERAHVKEIARWLMGSPFARELVADAMRLMKGIPLTGSGEPLAPGAQPYCPLNSPPGCQTRGRGPPMAFYQLYHDCCNRRTSRRMPEAHWVSMARNKHNTGLRMGGLLRPRGDQPGYCQDVDLEQLTRAIRPGFIRQRQLGEYSALLLLGFAAASPPCAKETWGRRGANGTWLGTASALMLKKKRPLPCRDMASMPWQEVDLQHDAIYWGTKGKAPDPLNDPSRHWSVLGYEHFVGGLTMSDLSFSFFLKVFKATESPSQHVEVDRAPFAAPMPLCSYFILSVPSFLNYSKFLIILTAYLEQMYPTAFADDPFHPFKCFVPMVFFKFMPSLESRCISYFMEAMTMTYLGNVKKLVYVSQKCEVKHFPDLNVPSIHSNGLFRHEGIDAIFDEMLRHVS